ncbi:MAG TPA: hypothetical protein VFL14_06940, partial [Xanthomonadales bacterium]|nr:hypothetical protein [Xanthomonadales bacterium]
LAVHARASDDGVFGPLDDGAAKPQLASREELGAIVAAIVAESAPETPDAPQLVVVNATVSPCRVTYDRECTEYPAADADELGVAPGDRATLLEASSEPASIPCPDLPRVTCLSQDELTAVLGKRDWDAYYRRFGRGAFMQFSPPLLSADGSRAIVYMAAYCGSLCAHGQRITLGLRDGKWVIVAREGLWIS